jgi:hypothetical protein
VGNILKNQEPTIEDPRIAGRREKTRHAAFELNLTERRGGSCMFGEAFQSKT